MNALFRWRLVFVILIAAGGGAGLYRYLLHDYRDRAIRELEALNAQLREDLSERERMIERLSVTRRLAHLRVTKQAQDEQGDIMSTTLELIELDDEGTELARQEFTVPGDVVYVDAWTVKFEQEDVAIGHPLRGRTLVLLRRVYSEWLAPRDGFAIDTPGAVPPAYAAGDVGQYERELWRHFWDIATDWRLARDMGVRVAQGEAVYKPVKVGQVYELIVDAVGGMSLTPLPDAGATLSLADE